jgi:hypothetical protein
MPNLHYQLVACGKCEGELYGPVEVKVGVVTSLDEQIHSIEAAIAESHPNHQLGGLTLKRYSDSQLPQY